MAADVSTGHAQLRLAQTAREHAPLRDRVLYTGDHPYEGWLDS